MNPSTAPLPIVPDFINQVLWLFPKSIENGFIFAFSIIKQFVFANIFSIIIIFFIVVLFAFGEYLFTGRWEMLGSVFYRSFKYIILFVSGLIFGAGIFASDWFEIVSSIIGLVCFFLVRQILKKLNMR